MGFMDSYIFLLKIGDNEKWFTFTHISYNAQRKYTTKQNISSFLFAVKDIRKSYLKSVGVLLYVMLMHFNAQRESFASKGLILPCQH